MSQDQSVFLPLFPFLNGRIPRVKLQIETTQNLSFLYSMSLINSVELCYERIAKELRAKGEPAHIGQYTIVASVSNALYISSLTSCK